MEAVSSQASEVDEKYLCPICRDVLKKPTSIQACGHVFCSDCVHQTPPTPDGNTLCPICRTPFLCTELRGDAALSREIATTMVTCRTCAVKCKLSHWSEHCSKHVPNRAPHSSHATRPSGPNRATFNCPLCPTEHLTSADLLTHANSIHQASRVPVVCPICAAMPWGVADQLSQNFIAHLNTRHKFEYDTYVDYTEDEEKTLEAVLKASITDH